MSDTDADTSDSAAAASAGSPSTKKALTMAAFVIGGLAIAIGASIGIGALVSSQNKKKASDGDDDDDDDDDEKQDGGGGGNDNDPNINTDNDTKDDDKDTDDHETEDDDNGNGNDNGNEEDNTNYNDDEGNDDIKTDDDDDTPVDSTATWVYYPGLTSIAMPITQVKNADVATLKKKCLEMTGAVMFHTNGQIYSYVDAWKDEVSTDPTRGTYILSSVDPNLNAENDGYTFFPCTDSDGNDLIKRTDLAGNVKALKQATDGAGGAGFNTSGYIKKTIAEQTKWRMFTKDLTKGLYVKNYNPQP
jgi:hypothetical protein